MNEIRWFVAHHTGEGPHRPTVKETVDYQIGPKSHLAFPAIAYTTYADGDGELYLTNDLETVSWANGVGSPTEKQGVGIFNWWTFSCCFAGENPNAAQQRAMARALLAAEEVLGTHLEVFGHREVSGGTECPGPEMKAWLLPLVKAG